MKKILLPFLSLILITSCSIPKSVAVSDKKPHYSRVAYIYDDKVIIVTKAEFTKDQYAKLIALREQNKEN